MEGLGLQQLTFPGIAKTQQLSAGPSGLQQLFGTISFGA